MQGYWRKVFNNLPRRVFMNSKQWTYYMGILPGVACSNVVAWVEQKARPLAPDHSLGVCLGILSGQTKASSWQPHKTSFLMQTIGASLFSHPAYGTWCLEDLIPWIIVNDEVCWIPRGVKGVGVGFLGSCKEDGLFSYRTMHTLNWGDLGSPGRLPWVGRP